MGCAENHAHPTPWLQISGCGSGGISSLKPVPTFHPPWQPECPPNSQSPRHPRPLSSLLRKSIQPLYPPRPHGELLEGRAQCVNPLLPAVRGRPWPPTQHPADSGVRTVIHLSKTSQSLGSLPGRGPGIFIISEGPGGSTRDHVRSTSSFFPCLEALALGRPVLWVALPAQPAAQTVHAGVHIICSWSKWHFSPATFGVHRKTRNATN